jgi:hypothetical protein
MRRLWLIVPLGALLVLGGGVGVYLKYRNTDSFFNGKDLEGWEGRGEYWSVRDGALVGASPEGAKFNTFLCSKKTYKDFELRFQVKLKGKGWTGNSGVNIRSAVADRKKFSVAGPQCDMGQYYWGCLYGERTSGMMKEADKKLVSQALKVNDFNDYYIRCVGKHVTIKLNGATTVDDDFDDLPPQGIIAWQVHAGPPMVVIFRNIEFTDLSAK